MGWFDTHCHLADNTLSGQLEAVLDRARQADVEGILCVAVDEETSSQTIHMARQNEMIRASVGIHPNHAQLARSEAWDSISALCSQQEVVALGETGLDKYWDDCPFELQLSNFRRHWNLSRQTKLPVIIHMRDCEAEMLEALRHESQKGELCGVMHSFSGTLDAAKVCLQLGLYISFAGMVTYKKSDDLRTVASQIPLDRLLIETDSPYLSPEPKRGYRPNEPSLLVHTARVIAHAQGVSEQELMDKCRKNTAKLFPRWGIAA